MASRLNLQEELEEILGNENVYFQPPETLKMEYPCIVYEMDQIATKHADNKIYKKNKRYSMTYITSDPDDTQVDSLLDHFQMISFERQYKSDNLYHNVMLVYY